MKDFERLDSLRKPVARLCIPRRAIPGRGGSRIFFRRGCTRLLLYFNTNKPLGFFFLENSSCIRKPQVISGGGGVRTPCTLPLDPPLPGLAKPGTKLRSVGKRQKTGSNRKSIFTYAAMQFQMNIFERNRYLRPVSNVVLLPCRTQFINYKYIRIYLKVC